jgi:oxygen-independent coproporphyrinogen III oxidase
VSQFQIHGGLAVIADPPDRTAMTVARVLPQIEVSSSARAHTRIAMTTTDVPDQPSPDQSSPESLPVSQPGGSLPGGIQIDAALLNRYDRPGPRYTSYPTAVEFHDGFGADNYVQRLAALSADDEVSLYLHLPFCDHRCHFCGCHVVATQHLDVAEIYLNYLRREIEQVATILGRRPQVSQYHWGGGTPTYYTPEQMRRLQATVLEHFDLTQGAEVAIEVDPRVTSTAHIDALWEMGFNRLSMGVQDFDDDVQRAIGRGQTEEQTRSLYHYARDKGFTSINMDLIYGLPEQTPESFGATMESVLHLRPDRLAVYSYAHVPWVRSNQKRIDEETLPDRDAKFALLAQAISTFRGGGYEQIGMDHFALPEDELAQALGQRTLHRNFMGYTVSRAPDMIGLGISAIGDVAGAYAQNQKKLSTYYADLDAGRLPIERGYGLSEDDRVRRHIISELMCNLWLDTRAVEQRYAVDFAVDFAKELAALQEGPVVDGLAVLHDDAIEVTALGQLFVRNVCMPFDAYMNAKQRSGPTFSRTV